MARPQDPAEKATDAIIAEIERKINKEYTQAHREITERAKEHWKAYQTKDKIWQRWVSEKKKTEKEYRDWLTGQLAIGQRWEEMRDSLAEDLTHTREIAKSIATGYMPEVYALNHDYATFQVEKGSLVDTSYTLYSREAAERLYRDDPKLLPDPGKKTAADIARGELKRYEASKLQSVMMQAILQGNSVPDIATRFQNALGAVGESERKAAIRNARTMATAAQNGGRIDSYKRANNMGIPTRKQWMATLDKRTRHAHRELDGQTEDVDKPFVNEFGEILYPGDPDARPANVYNCRCTLIASIRGFERDLSDTSLRYDAKLEGMSYDDWKAEKKSKSNPIDLPEKKAEAMRAKYIREYRGYGGDVAPNLSRKGLSVDPMPAQPKASSVPASDVLERLRKSGIESIKPAVLSKPRSTEEIIEAIGGPDQTKGSCASVSLAYTGQRAGFDVRDFRGGDSQSFFSSGRNLREIFSSDPAIENTTEKATNDISACNKLLKTMKKGKEYILVTGKHAAVVRLSDNGPEYLELQGTEGQNKFLPLDNDTLKWRFGAQKSHTIAGQKYDATSTLTEVETLGKSREFEEMLGYLNTEKGKERKGIGGGKK